MKSLITFLLITSSTLSFSQTKADEEQVNKLVDELVEAFNSHDFSTLKNNSTEDVTWVNIVGMWWKGRDQVVGAHYGVFNTVFKGVKFQKKSVTLRSITSDVLLANLIFHVGEFFPPDGVDRGSNKRNAADDNATLIFVKKSGKWLLTAGQNTVIDPNAVPPRL